MTLRHQEKNVRPTPSTPADTTARPLGILCIQNTSPVNMVSADIAPTNGQISGGRM
jgi:hypothetical protein